MSKGFKMQKLIVGAIAIMFLLFSCFLAIPTAKAATDATLLFDQSSVSADAGDTVTLVARVNPGTNEVGAVELDVTFNPSILRLDSITRSAAFNITLGGPTIDNIGTGDTDGNGSIDVGLLTDPATYVTITSDVATFVFTALNSATDSPVAFAVTSNVSAHGSYVVQTRTPSAVTVAGYTVGGTASGLTGTVVLQNNLGDDLSVAANGSFTFGTSLPDSAAYSVTILTQPTGQTCVLSNESGTIASANVTNVGVTCANESYTVGGTVSGLTDTVVLQNNLGDDLSVAANGSYTFVTSIEHGSAYDVTVLTQPAEQTCTVSNHSGTMGAANVTNIGVACSAITYTVGGTVSGLDADGTVVLQNNLGDDLSVADNGAFIFDTELVHDAAYSVTILTQPTGQTCVLSNESGTIASANVTNVGVTCANESYTVGGTVSGLTDTVVLQNNLGDDLSVAANGSYTFVTSIEHGSAYDVTVLTQPAEQTCTVSNHSGTMGGANVTNVGIACSASVGPMRSDGSPSGELDKGTNQATLALSTDVNATCAFSTTAETTYGSMTYIFDGAGTTTHTYALSGLSDGTQYTYYVRCQDEDLSVNTDDYVISFSVEDDSHKKVVQKANRKISVFPKRVKRGGVIIESGKRFSKKSEVALYFSKYGGGYYAPRIVKTDSVGKFSLSYQFPANKQIGTYHWYAKDLKTGRKSKLIYYKVVQ